MIQNTNYGTSKTYVDTNIGVWNWSATRTYSSGDIVSYSGILYVSLQNDNTNQIPSSATTYWGVYNKSGSANVGIDLKPIKLVSGVPTAVANDLVSTVGAQTINGVKTFSGVTNMFAINYERTGGYLEQCTVPTEERGTVPSSQIQIQPMTINDKDGQQLYFEQYITGTDGSRRFRKNLYTTQNTRVQIEDLWAKPDGTGWRGSPTLPNDAPTNALTTISYVSQTGDSAPNNLVHRTGDETILGVKSFTSPVQSKYFLCNRFSITPQNSQYWVKVYTYNNSSHFAVPSFAFMAVTREHSDIIIGTAQLNQSGGTIQSVTLKGITTNNNMKPLFVVTSESIDEFTVWYNCTWDTGGLRANVMFSLASNYAMDNVTSVNGGGAPQQAYDISQTGYTDENGVTHTFIAYAVMT